MAPLNTHTAQPRDESVHTDDDVPPTTARHAVGRRFGLRKAPSTRVAAALGVATVCSLALVNLLSGEPAANATADSPSVAVAAALGIDGSGIDAPAMEEPQLLDQLAASRSERDAEQAAAAQAQAQAEEAAAAAKAQAEAKAAAEAAAPAQAAAAAAAPSAPAASVAASIVAKISNSAGAVKAVTQNAANGVVSNVSGASGITIGGTRASAADPGGHPSGLALDYMVLSNVSMGDAIVQYHVANWDALGVEYLIYRQRMLSSPNGAWKPMEDRGSVTQNHMDHVHVNYRG